MLAEIGLASAFLAFCAALYAIAASVFGARRRADRWVISGRNAAVLTFPLLILAALSLLAALLSQQYQMSYVWTVTDPDTPTFFRITALWGSQQGSLLFWSLLMSGYAAAAILLNWRSQRRLMPYVVAYTMATLAFFLGLVLFIENPFQRFWITPDLAPTAAIPAYVFIPPAAAAPSLSLLASSAHGLNPLLRYPEMIVHPPMLYMGFVGFVIPFAFAMAALASGDLSTGWIAATRRWALIAWLFLSLGLLLGGHWAYGVLGWGGYWGWDPVENAAFIPWLVGTAFLHSVMIQEKRGMLKLWNMFLVIGAFSAVIFGTFATRSGLVDSVHAFARSNIGYPMFAFWAGMTLISVGLILWRRSRGQLKDEHPFVSVLSRESLFVLNNVVFVVLALAIFWGSFGAPIVSDLFMNTTITEGAEYFKGVTPPLFVALYILMGIAPLSAWGVTSVRRLGKAMAVPLGLTAILLVILIVTGVTMPGALLGYGVVAMAGLVALYEIYRGAAARRGSLKESWLTATLALFGRNRRRYGGYLIHLGITVIGIGVIGSTLFQQQTQRTLAVGQTLDFGGYQMTYDGIQPGQVADDGRIMDISQVTVSRNGQTLAQLRPRHDLYSGSQGTTPMNVAGLYSSVEGDFYVLLADYQQPDASSAGTASGAGGAATFKVFINPLINFIWFGGLILIIGTMVAVWKTESAPVSARERSRAGQQAGATA